MEQKLFFGKPENYQYDDILDLFSQSKINSIRTSSVPLVQYWKKTNQRFKSLKEMINLDSKRIDLCFEYPTASLGKNKSSMTDLMILSGHTKIAIEAKFTEYSKMPSDLVKKWRIEGNKENRAKVLKHWKGLLQGFTNGINQTKFEDISYQFLHRTASACKNCTEAIVIYQLFYDDRTKDYLPSYKNSLEEYSEYINPNNKLSFFIWEIEADQKYKNEMINSPFIKMKSANIYNFKDENFSKIA